LTPASVILHAYLYCCRRLLSKLIYSICLAHL
jgi:hypothetical protein